ncbi:MAG: branched-chain amino acid ABC transporter permease [Proteobacteria bacterium]|nr:branched-chain amino acid ABC transporter permease [Pseudomonadota bacterium]
MFKKPCGTFDEAYEKDTAMVRTPFRWVMLALLFALMFLVFPFVAGAYLLDVANNIGITIIAVLGLQILVGFTGLISLGHAAFMAAGAYTSAMLSEHLGWPFYATMPLAALVSGLLGMLVSLPALRIRGFYIAVSTVAAHYIILWFILHGGDLTMGTSGLTAHEISMGGFVFDSEFSMYYVIMGLTVLVVFLLTNLMRTKIGRAMLAVRDNDLAAEFMGINVFRTKVLAFFLSSVCAGMAGALLAHYQGLITVDQFTLIDSIWFLGMLIIGGPTIIGAIFGAIFLRLLSQLVLFMAPFIGGIFPAFSGTAVSGFTQIFFGLVIILFLVFEPRGLAHRWQITLSTFRLWPFKTPLG